MSLLCPITAQTSKPRTQIFKIHQIWLLIFLVSALSLWPLTRLHAYDQPSACSQLRACSVPESTVQGSLAKLSTVPITAEDNVFYFLDQFSVGSQGVQLDLGEGLPSAQVKQVFIVVTGPEASQIEGAVNVKNAFPEANLWIINPNGLIWEKNATIEAGGSVVCSTAPSVEFANGHILKARHPQAQPGEPVGLRLNGERQATIRVAGMLQVSAGKWLALAANRVEQVGHLVSQGGYISVVALAGSERIGVDGGSRFQVPQISSCSKAKGSEGIAELSGTLDVSNPTPGGAGGQVQILSSVTEILGTIQASGFSGGGQVNLHGHKLMWVGDIQADATDGNGGTLSIDLIERGIQTDLASATVRGGQFGNGGKIVLQSGTDSQAHPSGFFLSGDLVASAGQAGKAGGSITVLGNRLDLIDARLEANGPTGGGSIQIGRLINDVQSAHQDLNVETSQNAIFTRLSASTEISANAGVNGNGGQVQVWSEQDTESTASISARGGSQRGSGGQVEVSSRNAVSLNGEIDVDATAGESGKLVLDPKNIVIQDTTGTFPQFNLVDPNSGTGSGFGTVITPLQNGNIVVVKTNDEFIANTNTVLYLYNGHTGALISTLRAWVTSGFPGFAEVVELNNSNFVVRCPGWGDSPVFTRGAVTWVNGTTGLSGTVNDSNSLVGTSSLDQVGSNRIVVLKNGNYVVVSPYWDNGAIQDVGAITWGNGTTGTVGSVSSSNSMIGSTPDDFEDEAIAQYITPLVVPLENGNYVVDLPFWDNGAIVDAGAVTWGNGATGTVGVIGAANSVVGGSAGDRLGLYVVEGIGSYRLTALTNGNYVVCSPHWTNGAIPNAGAVTWGNGATGTFGTVSSTNSLVGSTANDNVGIPGVRALTNGNYVVSSSAWHNGTVLFAGAVTWGNGAAGVTGAVSIANSLVGTRDFDIVGGVFGSSTIINIVALTNGNYVVVSPYWSNGVLSDAGAATWADGNTGITGGISASNSLVGAGVGFGSNSVIALTNGNYVVGSPTWDNGAVTNVGAVTWGNGTTGITGTISPTNSLIGDTQNDEVGRGITALTNGNYLVSSSRWHNSSGAVTWGNGTAGTIGVVSSINSLVGKPGDSIGTYGYPLTNGNYVVTSPGWKNGNGATVGAVTWGNGTGGTVGLVSATNSLVGSTSGDNVGNDLINVLPNGNYVVHIPNWDNGSLVNAGAVTWGNGTTGTAGVISEANSLVGTHAGDEVGGAYPLTLASGDYVVASPSWKNGGLNNAGAATWVNGATGQTATGSNLVSTENSIVGTIANAALFALEEDATGSTFLVYFVNNPTSGRVTVGIPNPNQLTFSRGQAAAMTIPTSFLKQTLDAGTDVVLQASTNITLSSPLSVAASGGNLTLQAGRSITLSATVTTVDSDVTLLANQPASTGVVSAQRDGGAAIINASAAISLGTGNFLAQVDNGAGLASSTSGAIILNTVRANTITINNFGPTANAGRIRVTGTLTGSCTGASLCTVSSGGGAVTINHPNSGSNFFIGNASTNGTAGSISTGSATVVVPTTIVNAPGTFSQGNISISPGVTPPPPPPDLLFVADTLNNRIQHFDGTTWTALGTTGTGSGQFRVPEAVVSNNSGRIYVADTGNNRIQWSTNNGTTWANFATLGTGNNQVRAPQGVTLDKAGNLYISDTGNGRVLRFNGGTPGAGVVISSKGIGVGQVLGPQGLAIDGNFQLFVADATGSRILRIKNANTVTSSTSGTIIAVDGTTTNRVRNPQGVGVDTAGTLFIADTGNSRILRFVNASSASSSALALSGTQLGKVNKPEGVTVKVFQSGPLAGGPFLVVSDTGNNRIQGRLVASEPWALVGAPNGSGTGSGQFKSPSKLQ